MLAEREQTRQEINAQVDHGIKAMCFDLDGVLVDAADWHKLALNRALEFYGFDGISEEDHIKTYNGLGTYRKLEMLGIPKKYHRGIYGKKQDFTIDYIDRKCKTVERIRGAVSEAYRLFGGNICVVTNCSRYTAELMLKKAGLFDLFKFIVTNEDVDGKIKPHPWPYIFAQQKLGFTKNKEVLAVDDTGRGIISAVDARCRTWFLKNFEDLTADNLNRVLDGYRITI